MDLESRVVERITEYSSIDTSPSYSPDGKYIRNNSDEVVCNKYVMKNDGSDVKNYVWRWFIRYTSLVARRFDRFY